MIAVFSSRAAISSEETQILPCIIPKPTQLSSAPLRGPCLALFMAVMAFYMERRDVRMTPALIRVMLSLRAVCDHASLDRQRAILAAAADYVSYVPAVVSPSVKAAIDGAKAALRGSWEDEARQRKMEGNR